MTTIPRNSVASYQAEAIQHEFFEESYSVEDLSRRHFLPVDQVEAAIREVNGNAELEEEVRDLRHEVSELEDEVSELEDEIAKLESKVAALEAALEAAP